MSNERAEMSEVELTKEEIDYLKDLLEERLPMLELTQKAGFNYPKELNEIRIIRRILKMLTKFSRGRT